MSRVFKTIEGIEVDEVEYTKRILELHPDAKVYVGSDSQRRARSIKYAVSIVYRYDHKGCHIIYSEWYQKKERKKKEDQRYSLIEKRLIEEITTTIAVADDLRSNGIEVYQIDFDLNEDPKWESHKIVQWAVGWAKGVGYRVSIKPDEQVATKASNNLVNG